MSVQSSSDGLRDCTRADADRGRRSMTARVALMCAPPLIGPVDRAGNCASPFPSVANRVVPGASCGCVVRTCALSPHLAHIWLAFGASRPQARALRELLCLVRCRSRAAGAGNGSPTELAPVHAFSASAPPRPASRSRRETRNGRSSEVHSLGAGTNAGSPYGVLVGA